MAAVGGSVGGNKWRQSDTHAHPVLGLGFSAVYTLPMYFVVNYMPSNAKKKVYHFGWWQCGGHKAFLGGSRRHWRQCGRQGWAAVLAALQFEGGSMAAVSSVTWRQCDVGGGNLSKWRQLVGGSWKLNGNQCAVDPRRGNGVGKLDASQMATFEARFRAHHTIYESSQHIIFCQRHAMPLGWVPRTPIWVKDGKRQILTVADLPPSVAKPNKRNFDGTNGFVSGELEEEQEMPEAQDAEISTEANPTRHKYETQ
ncbi:hypothetical protein B0H11DRAFT_1915913 [Mycena galericulata]|nr:hypothetical protein B0H11DRAFT_1915913 [Mycena galericulata]